jgi:hypothetical protein
MSRKLVVAALAAGCLIGFGACNSVRAESSVKSSKSNAHDKQKGGGQGQPVKPTSDKSTTSSGGDRTDSEYGPSGAKGR